MPNCKQCNLAFKWTDEDHRLFKKFGNEPTDLCFECDQKNRLCFRNERTLYTRKCDFSDEAIVSVYSPDKPYIVYKSEHWYGDKWDPLEYGQEFDFSRPFFDQYKEVQLKAPRLALMNVKGENSEYCNMTYGNKNCYLIFGGDFNENVLYGTLCMRNLNSMDLDYSNENEQSYMLGDSINCYGCQFAFDSKNCNNCFFISDCIGCSECILCTNLANKSYCIENKQYEKAEYLEKKKEFLMGSYKKQQEHLKNFLELRKKRIVKFAHMINCQNCSGDYIKNSKNCHNCFDTSDSEDLRNIIFASKAKDCFNCSLLGDGSEVCYNLLSTIRSIDSKFSFFTIDSFQIEYSEFSINSKHLFGCSGLRHKEHCILNKQYTKKEYEELRKKIIEHMKKTGEWGQFLPKTLSCFSYQETTAHDYYPLTKEQAIKESFKWHEESKKDYKQQTYKIPDNIADVPSSITDEILACVDCKKNFKIAPQEFKFYRRNNIPIPHQCPDCRHKVRTALRNPKKLWDRKCQKCNTNIKTTYNSDRPETVYCEECYLKEVY